MEGKGKGNERDDRLFCIFVLVLVFPGLHCIALHCVGNGREGTEGNFLHCKGGGKGDGGHDNDYSELVCYGWEGFIFVFVFAFFNDTHTHAHTLAQQGVYTRDTS